MQQSQRVVVAPGHSLTSGVPLNYGDNILSWAVGATVRSEEPRTRAEQVARSLWVYLKGETCQDEAMDGGFNGCSAATVEMLKGINF